MPELSTPHHASPGRRPVSPYRRRAVGHDIPRIGQLLDPATRAAQRWRDADNDLNTLTDFYRRSRERITRLRQLAEQDLRAEMTCGGVVGIRSDLVMSRHTEARAKS